jgi:hypothetical protein
MSAPTGTGTAGAPRASGALGAPPVAGPVLFARYAYPPGSLGYCGPADPSPLLEAGSPGADVAGLGRLAAQFDGAWPYLELVAGCNGIADPLDRRVVEAYWVGNELLSRVPGSALAASMGERFARRAGRRFEPLEAAAGTGGVPQHSFHVFAVYPWLGLLRAGTEGPPLVVLDRCRIRWGTVVAVAGDQAMVRTRSLAFDGWRLVLGPERMEVARRAVDGVGLATEVRPGDSVSLHWDWICDRLSPRSLAWLRACTRRNLDVVNSLDRPGPAVVCDV